MQRTNRRILSVYQINQYIKTLLEADIVLGDLCVEAEISNFKLHSSGHMYFTLKDELAAVNCVMFRSQARELAFMPENGMKVILFGRVSLYEKTGVYQIYAEYMEPAGIGALYLAFERLKDKLGKEGLFDARHKKQIPSFPSCIAVITSPTGAVLHDIIHVTRRRNPLVQLVAVPVSVQGVSAAEEVAYAIEDVNKWGLADVIIIARGGGSLEDLWAFNQEISARAAFKSKIPIISAIGHETDFTIMDFVADLRAPTPSAAAELAVPVLDELVGYIAGLTHELNRAMRDKTDAYRVKLEILGKVLSAERLLERIYDTQLYTERLMDRLGNTMRHKLQIAALELSGTEKRLEAVTPYAVLKRGYSILYSDGKVIPSVSSLMERGSRDRELIVKMYDGEVKTELVSVEKHE